ncbi:glucose-repressible protein [Grosmannia clavigera kw1407]|uniref:Glucose-repressible protein n=1 Tax=Grosmannia clavigera (strain kw1407 / UAMH 11150) TaxID=655863 RepID=F0X974_GROCL|nr:glucose-repressible protein [Grosmannia clavigera kw1407]EFX05357.1 glucose-repressible protein [Grosmannia clavigera kw1407]
MDTLKQAGNFVSDKVNSATAGTAKEANKNVASDSNQSIGTRAQAGVDAVKNKATETKHDTSAEANKQAATH